MHLLTGLVVPLLCACASAAARPERTVDVLAWPLSAAQPSLLARVSYTPTNATVGSYHLPVLAPGEDVVRVGFRRASDSGWSGVATAASNFAAANAKQIRIHLDADDELYHVGFKATAEPGSGSGPGSTTRKNKNAKSDTDAGLSVEIVKMKPGPSLQLNKPVVLNEQGQLDGKAQPEKTFLQKYWWIIAAFLLMQVVVGSGGKE